jgi:hypothetical protein
MAKSKKPAKMANRNVGVAQVQIQDDGDKYLVVRAGRVVYPGQGLPLADAVRLASTLAEPAGVAKVDADGALTEGTVLNGEFIAREAAAAEAIAA